MDKLKILHTADWHVCDEFLEDAKACLLFLVNQAFAQQPNLIVISGDIYNHRQIRQETKAARLAFDVVAQLAYIAPVIILQGTPSHDGNAPELLAALTEKHPVYVMSQPETVCLYAKKIGSERQFARWDDTTKRNDREPVALISGVPAFTKQYFRTDGDIETTDMAIAKELASLFAKFGADRTTFNLYQRHEVHNKHLNPHILLGHWSIGGAYVHPAQGLTGLDIEVSRDHIDFAQADLVCMGHIHAQQQIGRTIFYPGSLFSTDFGETEKKGFHLHFLELVDLGGVWDITESRFIETPSPTLIKLKTDLLDGKTDDIANLAIMKSYVGMQPNPNAIIRHEVLVYQDIAHTIHEEIIKAKADETVGPRSFRLDIVRLPRPNVRSAKVLEVDKLRDKLEARAEIIGDPLSPSVLEKADILEAMDHENVLDLVQKGVN